jgi:tetratricopeptide (TPR) repeat protein
MFLRYPLAWLAVGFILTAFATPWNPAAAQKEADLARHYAAAQAAEKARSFQAALDAYEKVLDVDPDYQQALDRWEVCQKLAEWQVSLKKSPATAQDLVRLGEIYAGFDRFDEERHAYRDAIALDDRCADAHGHLAMSNYTSPGGSMVTVVQEIRRLLETSPNRARLDRALADWAVYGELRILRHVMKDDLARAQQANQAGRPKEAAEILEAAAKKDGPDVYRTSLLTQAGALRLRAGDRDGAYKAFRQALLHVRCLHTIHAHLGLAELNLEVDRTDAALDHLRQAVAEGSLASRLIEAGKNGTYRKLFESAKPEIREEMKRLADPRTADAPIRASIQEALARATREKKTVLLEWYGPYCPYVMSLEERLAHPRIQKLLDAHFVLVRMNQGSVHRGDTLDEEYGQVMRKYGVPCFFVLNPDGTIHVAQSDADLMSAPNRSFGVEEIATWLEKMAARDG